MLHSRVRSSRDEGRGGASLAHRPPALCSSPAGAPAGAPRMKGWKLAEGLPLSLSRSSKGKVSGLGWLHSLLSWSRDQWIWIRLLESSHPTRCGSTVDTCGILFHGAQNCQLQTLQHKRKKTEQESQKEMALPGQRPGSQRDKTHTARGDELLVTADLKSAW